MIDGTMKPTQLPLYFDPHYSPSQTSQTLLWVEIKQPMFLVVCKNLQTSVGCMLVKCHRF